MSFAAHGDVAQVLLDYVEQNRTFRSNRITRIPYTNYTDPERWSREMALIFKRVPLMLALTAELPNPGDYKAMNALGLPILITAGIPPTGYPDSMRGAREPEGHLWLQQTFDQNGIVRQFTKWDHKLQFQDNPGLMVSRALQVACAEPRGPVYLSIPREISLMQTNGARFPTLAQLGVAMPSAPNPEGIRELAARLVNSDNPFILVGRSGRNPATVPALVELAESLGVPVAQSAKRAYHNFPLNHPLYQSVASLKDADFVKKQEGLGAVVVTDKRMESAEHKKFVADEIAKWSPVLKAAGVYAD